MFLSQGPPFLFPGFQPPFPLWFFLFLSYSLFVFPHSFSFFPSSDPIRSLFFLQNFVLLSIFSFLSFFFLSVPHSILNYLFSLSFPFSILLSLFFIFFLCLVPFSFFSAFTYFSFFTYLRFSFPLLSFLCIIFFLSLSTFPLTFFFVNRCCIQ